MCFKFTAILRQNWKGRYSEVRRLHVGYDTIELYFRTMGAMLVLLRKKLSWAVYREKFNVLQWNKAMRNGSYVSPMLYQR